MKNILFVTLLIFVSLNLFSQEMNIHKKDGSVVKINLSNIDSITFSDVIVDLEGNKYHTVTIGTQTWFVENLVSSKLNDGTPISKVTDNTWGTISTPAYCYYNNDSATFAATYGKLYNWYVVNSGKVCPKGWHVPSAAEWSVIDDLLGGVYVSGAKLKESGLNHWKTPNTDANNSTGFTALPGGLRATSGGFFNITEAAQFWTSTEVTGSTATMRYMQYNSAANYTYDHGKTTGLSIRCVKD